MTASAFQASPQAESYRLLDFDSVVVRPGFVNNTFFLTVTGTAPCINMKITLSPLIYIDCPEYWGIEVVGNLPGGICLEQTAPFTETISLTGVTGSKGIEVIGRTKREKQTVSGGCSHKQRFIKSS